MAAAGPALIGIGTVAGIASSLSESEAAARRRRDIARENRRKSIEVMERLEITSEQLRLEAQGISAEQTVKGISAGLSAESSLRLITDTERKLQRQLVIERREAEFRAEALLRGADIEERLAKEEKKAGKLRAFSFLARGGGQALRGR